MDGGGGGGGRAKRSSLSHPSPYFWLSTAPLVHWFISLPTSAAIKSKHSLAKSTSALQASLREASPKSARELWYFQSDLWQKLPNVKRVLWNFLEPSHLASFIFSFLSLREKFLKILLSSSLNPSLKRSRANTAKSRQPQVSWGQQCFVWFEVITKYYINTIMLWSLPVILVNFSFFALHCGIFSSHHIRLVFFPFLPWRRNIF